MQTLADILDLGSIKPEAPNFDILCISELFTPCHLLDTEILCYALRYKVAPNPQCLLLVLIMSEGSLALGHSSISGL